MKKLLIGLSALFLLFLDGCGCSQGIDSVEPMYVSSAEYEEMSCKQLKEKYPYGKLSCKEVKEKLVYISPTEYEKLSCKQLNEELIKINERLDAKSQLEIEQGAINVLGVVFTVGVPLLFTTEEEEERYRKKVDKHDSEIRRLKEGYETLKNVSTKKNCSFVVDMK